MDMDNLDTTCPTSGFQENVSVVMVIVSVSFLVCLSFTNRRKLCKTECCGGRPGSVIPLNFFNSQRNRLGYALAFGITTMKCVLVFSGHTKQILGPKLYNIFYGSGAKVALWLTTFTNVVVCLMLALAYYPLFTCMNMRHKIIGGAIGFGFSLIWLSEVCETIRTLRQCASGKGQIWLYFRMIPLLVMSALLVCKFTVMMWKGNSARTRRTDTGTNSSLWSDLFVVDNDSLDLDDSIKHVKNLFKKKQDIDDDENNNRSWFQRISRAIYRWDPDFRFSQKIIAVATVSSVAVYLVIFQLFNLISDSTGVSQAYSGTAMTFTVVTTILMMLHFFRSHRAFVLRLRQGDTTGFPRSILQGKVSKAFYLANGLRFAGYQIGLFIVGVIYHYFIFLALFVFLGELIIKPIFTGQNQVIISRWPIFFTSILVFVAQFVVSKVFFLQGKGKILALDNRRAFNIFAYFQFFLSIPIGMFAGVSRILLSLIHNLLFLPILQASALPKSFENWDFAHTSYLYYVMMEHTFCNPVMLMFCHILPGSKGNGTSECTSLVQSRMRNYSSVDSLQAEGLLENNSGNQSSLQNILARNRWHVAYTLIRNPTLVCYRSPRRTGDIIRSPSGRHIELQDQTEVVIR